MKLILNADDFGLSQSVNKGILECLDEGLVSSTTMMMNTPYTDEAIKLAKDRELKNIGIHLNLTYGKSVLPASEIPSLVDENGTFHYVCMLGYYTQYVDAKKELRAQIEKFLDSGLKPDHLDHHHYFNEIPNILKAYLELAQDGVDISTFDVLKSLFWGRDISLEVLTHVGYIDDYTRGQTNYLVREDEIKVLREAKAKGYFDDVELVGFGEI